MRRPRGSAQGSTAVHLLFFVGVLTVAWALVLTTVGTAMFQPSATARRGSDGEGENSLQRARGLFSDDVSSAEATDLVSGAPPASAISLSWTEKYRGVPVPSRVSYELVGNALVRTYDDSSNVVARNVASVAFSLSDDTVTAVFEVRTPLGVTETSTLSASLKR